MENAQSGKWRTSCTQTSLLVSAGAVEESCADNKLRGVMKAKAEGDAVDSQPATSNALMWNPQELLEQLDNDRAFLCELLLVYLPSQNSRF